MFFLTDLRQALAFPRHLSPEFCSTLAPIEEGAGNAGCRLHPWSSRERLAQKRALTDRFSRDIPAFPAQWFTAYFALSPVNQLGCHRRRRDAQSASSSAWRLHGRARTTRLRRPRPYRPSSTHPRPPQPASRVVTFAIRPSSFEAGWSGESPISEKRKANYFHPALLNAPMCLDSARQISFCAQVILCGRRTLLREAVKQIEQSLPDGRIESLDIAQGSGASPVVATGRLRTVTFEAN